MSMKEMTIEEFNEVLASKAAVPGGGGASALVGSIGICLGKMVGSLTVGKKKYADVEEEMHALMDKAKELSDSLLACIDEDAVAFEPLSKAYGIPKDDPDRDEIMEKCLREAAKVPFKILELSCQAIEILDEFAKKGSRLVISDAATGAAMCQGAIKGAAVNVKINTKSMKDREYADELNAKVDELVNKYTGLAEEVYNGVYMNY